MEYMPGGDFLGLLIRHNVLQEDVARFYIAEMILAVEEVHRLRFIHRDIKPDNFLITASGHLKITGPTTQHTTTAIGILLYKSWPSASKEMSMIRKLAEIFSSTSTGTEPLYLGSIDMVSILESQRLSLTRSSTGETSTAIVPRQGLLSAPVNTWPQK